MQTNKWYHICFRYDSNTKYLSLFVNNTSADQLANVDPATFNTSPSLKIGSYNNDGPFSGKIDDTRFYNRALSDTEIDSLYHEGGWPYPAVPVMAKNITSIPKPINMDSLSAGYIGVWNILSSNGSGYLSGDTLYNGKPGETYNLKFTVTNSGGLSNSDTIAINFICPTYSLAIDTVFPLCNSVAEVTLSANPTGGIFSGNGVYGGYFYPDSVNSGSYKIKYNYTDTYGCISSDSTIIIVNATPAAISGITNVCAGSSTTLNDATSGGTWSSSNTSNASVAGGIVTGLSQGTSVITYSLATGCSVDTTVTVNPLPDDITGITNVCAGSSTTLNDATSGGTWSSSNTSNASVAGGIVTGLSQGTSVITYSLATGCSVDTTVTVNPLPDDITGITNVCAGSSTTLNDATSGGTWSSSNTSNASVAGGIVTGISQGTSVITYSLATGCSVDTTVTVNANPVLTVSVNPSSIRHGETAKLTASADGATYSWDHELGTNASVFVNPDTTTVYSVTATSNGCSATAKDTVKVIPTIVADFSVNLNALIADYQFTGYSSDSITSWYWTLGDGSYSTNNDTLTHTYTKAGRYNVCLNVYSAAFGLSADTCKEIIVGNANCSLTALFSADTTAVSDQVAFTNQSTGNVTNFWDFGDGSTSAGTNPVHTYANAGYYKVVLNIKNDTCVDEYQQQVKVGSPSCHANFSYTVNPATLTVDFSNLSDSASNFLWVFGDGNESTTPNPENIYATAGNYNVSLTISNSNESCFDFTEKTIQLGTVNCNAQFASYIDSSTSTGYFSNQSLGNITNFYWIFGDGGTSLLSNPSHNFTAPGYYSVELTVFDSLTQCMAKQKKVILISSEANDCEADFVYLANATTKSVQFADNSMGKIVNRVWDFGDNSISTDVNPTHQYTTTGYYDVCLTIANNYGITNQDCKSIGVGTSSDANCKSDFYYTIDPVSQKVDFVNSSIGNISNYKWDFGDRSYSNSTNTEHSYKKSRLYLVSLLVNNSSGCKDKHYELLNVGKTDIFSVSFGYDVKGYSKKADGYPVDFTGTGVGDHARLRWDFGDSTSVDTTSNTPTHIYKDSGYYEVCLTYSDQITNQSATSCEFVSTQSLCVDDTVKPVANCRNYTVTLNSEGTATILPDSINNGSTDNCGIYTMTINNTSFTTANIGSQNSVKLVVTDYVGNSDSCIATVTVKQGTAIVTETIAVDFKAYPNPFDNKIQIKYQLLKNATVNIGLYDLLGNYVLDIFDGTLQSGEQSHELNTSGLQSGAYILQLKASNGFTRKQMIIKK